MVSVDTKRTLARVIKFAPHKEPVDDIERGFQRQMADAGFAAGDSGLFDGGRLTGRIVPEMLHGVTAKQIAEGAITAEFNRVIDSLGRIINDPRQVSPAPNAQTFIHDDRQGGPF